MFNLFVVLEYICMLLCINCCIKVFVIKYCSILCKKKKIKEELIFLYKELVYVFIL